MRVRLFVLIAGFSGAIVYPGMLPAQSALPAALAQQIDAAEARVAQPSGQNDGVAWWQLGRLQQDAARYRDGEASYRRAIALLEGGDPASLANALDSAGTLYVETGEYSKAEPLEQRALTIREAQNDALGVGLSWLHLAVLSLGQHDSGAAVRYAQRAKQRLVDAKMQPNLAPSPEEKMTALADLALAFCVDGRCDRAVAPLTQARRLAVADAADAGEMPAGYLDFLLGYAHWHMGDTTQAGKLMKSGIAAMEAQLGFGHPTYIAALKEYRDFLEQSGDFVAAATVRERLARLEPSLELSSAASSGAPAR